MDSYPPFSRIGLKCVYVNVHDTNLNLFLMLEIYISEPPVYEIFLVNFVPFIYPFKKLLTEIPPEVLNDLLSEN